MIDSAPFHGWSDKVTVFWTFGDGTPTYILTVLGIILMVGSMIAWMWLEEKKLTAQVARLKAAGGAAGTLTPSGGDDA
jgi:hypothetical protein